MLSLRKMMIGHTSQSEPFEWSILLLSPPEPLTQCQTTGASGFLNFPFHQVWQGNPLHLEL